MGTMTRFMRGRGRRWFRLVLIAVIVAVAAKKLWLMGC
jgi:hypothetical protein